MTPEEKRRAIAQMNREHLEMAREQGRLVLEYIGRLKERGHFNAASQRSLDELAQDMRRRGEPIPAQLTRLLNENP